MAGVFKGTFTENKLASTDDPSVKIIFFLSFFLLLVCSVISAFTCRPEGSLHLYMSAYGPVFFVTSTLAAEGLDSHFGLSWTYESMGSCATTLSY